MKTLLSAAIVLTSFSFSALDASEVTVEKTDRGAVVKVDGQLFTEYLIKSGNKPICYPIIGPTGKAMTRHYPMVSDKVEGEKQDHPHHRSFWFTHGDVNGVSYWHEGANAGNIVHREFVKLESAGSTAVIVTRNDWIGPDGKKACSDERTLTFGADEGRRWIDFDITFTAAGSEPVKFGDTKEGSFGVRVAGTMKVDAKKGGQVVNSAGQTDGGAWGKPAAWVDYSGIVGDQRLGVAIMNHPSSFRFPTYWHVRTYGLFAANPFGLHDFKRSKDVDGSHRVPKGESLKLRYRVLIHRGDEKEGRVAEAYAEYAK